MCQVGPFPTTIQGKGQGNIITNSNGENFFGTFCEKQLQKTSQTEFRVEKKTKRKKKEKKDDRLYVK